MAAPQRKAEDFSNTTEHMDSMQRSLEKLLSLSARDTTETEMLRSRIDEQSSLICILKKKADDLFLQCQTLQKLNTELEGRETNYQKELDSERKKAELLEKRFMDLYANNQGIVTFMYEYKNENIQLKIKNKQLQSENDTLFSQKLHDKEMFVQKLMQEIKLLTENYTNKEKEYLEKLAEFQSKLLEQATLHQANETSLLDQLHDAQQQQRDAVETCKNIKLELQRAEEKYAVKEISMTENMRSLTKERNELLSLSMERGRVIQEKQEEIQQLERKLKEEKKSRAKAEARFEQDAECVNADVKVKSLQCALNESVAKYKTLEKDFKAFREYSSGLLTQERELNKKLRHMTG